MKIVILCTMTKKHFSRIIELIAIIIIFKLQVMV